MTYTLLCSPDSANIVVRMVLEELGVSYESKEVPDDRTDRSDEFFTHNPRGLLPVLLDNETDAVVFETGAVVLYLADRHGRLVPGNDRPAARADCLKWLFMISNTLHADLVRTFYPERHADDAETAKRIQKKSSERVASHFALLSRQIEASDSDWLLSSGLSVCDFYLACCLRWSQLYPENAPAMSGDAVSSLASLSAWAARVQSLASVETAVAKEGITTPAILEPQLP